MPKYIKNIIPRFKFHQRINQIMDIIFLNNLSIYMKYFMKFDILIKFLLFLLENQMFDDHL